MPEKLSNNIHICITIKVEKLLQTILIISQHIVLNISKAGGKKLVAACF